MYRGQSRIPAAREIVLTVQKDPFEITYNVARTVTKDGLYTVSGLVDSLKACL